MATLKDTHKGEAVLRLQQWLNIVSYKSYKPPIKEDGNFGPSTENALKQWQKEHGLLDDGIFGPKSFNTLRNEVRERLAGGNPQGVEKLPADIQPERNGYDFTRLRKDVAPSYMALYRACRERGILLTSAGGDRPLSASVGAGRSKTSLHYAAIAFDMSLATMLNNPVTDAYVIEALPNRRWRVWARVFYSYASNAPKNKTTIANPVTYAKRQGTGKPVTDYFVDFTALAKGFGFESIPAHSNYLTGAMTTLECWHFQFERILMPEFSTFGEEVLGVFNQMQLNLYPSVARYRNAVWKTSWHG